MTDFIELKVAPRDVIGKANRRLAADGLIPAVLYGHNVEPATVSLDRHNFEYLMSHEALASTILKVDVDGADGPVNAIVKEIQKHPVNGRVIHVDLFAISMKQKIQTAVPLHIIGESIGTTEGGILTQVLTEIEIEALPTELPDSIDTDVTELQVGDAIHVSDLSAPEGVEILSEQEAIVLSITLPKVEEEEPEEELEEGEVLEIGEEGEEGEFPEDADEASEVPEEE